MRMRVLCVMILVVSATPVLAQDSTKTTPPPVPARGSSNPRLLPDVSMVGDLIGDFSRRGSTQEGGQRFSIREVELAIQAAVDPYFRGDVFLGINDEEKIAIEQAYLTATALPGGLEARFGRFLMPFGKQNMTHRHDLHTIEYPWVLQRFLGAEGLKGTGIYVSKVFSPLGFYQELQVTATDRFGEFDESLQTAEPVNTKLANLGFSARLRNYIDLTSHANLEISASAITGKRPGEAVGIPGVNAVTARQSLIGVDATYRWRPLQQGLYRSFILQAEVLRQINGDGDLPAGFPAAAYLGPTENYTGGYIYSRYQLSRRTFLGARYDWVADPEAAGERLRAGSAYWQFFPSEFSKIVIGYERVTPPVESSYGRLLVQMTFAMGPHKPHPF